jgi:hypothetical protein
MSMTNTSEENLKLIGFAGNLTKTLINCNFHVRLFGSICVYLHCKSEHQKLLSEFPCNDIDLVARLDQLIELDECIRRQFKLESPPNFYKNGEQRIYVWEKSRHLENPIKLEVYFGQLYFNHLIPPPYFSDNTCLLPITQLLLSKLAIHKLTPKDIYSIALILDDHEIGWKNDSDIINLNTLLPYWTHGARGWGVSHSCLKSLKIVKDWLTVKPELYLVDHRSVCQKIEDLVSLFQGQKKSFFWQVRDKIGERVPWYRVANYNT